MKHKDDTDNIEECKWKPKKILITNAKEIQNEEFEYESIYMATMEMW